MVSMVLVPYGINSNFDIVPRKLKRMSILICFLIIIIIIKVIFSLKQNTLYLILQNDQDWSQMVRYFKISINACRKENVLKRIDSDDRILRKNYLKHKINYKSDIISFRIMMISINLK
ncbi:hypothetical protein BpHYR1_008024 [Brachionus plicatilis]|uniref:Uncharacterized protein n=1 Tax=Brachionus plicatilis TaxID=10195 RepID=A0A3M7PVF1_BRAPC|nr:hypothetical protein BpHYR1_008024 [Brachionus plicatilis]